MPGRSIAVLAGALLVCAATQTALAQSPEEFYKGRNISMIIGYGAGGGYDLYARVLSRHMSKHIPGNPNIVPQNMPGAGSQKALEFILNHAPKDGTAIGTFGRTLPIAHLIENAKYDPSKLAWVGSIATDSTTCVMWASTGIRTWDDLKGRQVTLGGLGKGSDPEIFGSIMRIMFGFNTKIVAGYRGTNDLALAMERGEIEGVCGWSYSSLKSSRRQWLAENKVSILMQAALDRDPSVPAHVPMLLEKATTADQKAALTLILAPQSVARPFAMPPGTPADRLGAIRTAFMAALKDPGFIAEAEKAALDVSPMTGEHVEVLYKRIYETPQAVIAEARRAIGN
jgi:tripartite-type tricarboxylate transporter receptor subunit TctC